MHGVPSASKTKRRAVRRGGPRGLAGISPAACGTEWEIVTRGRRASARAALSHRQLELIRPSTVIAPQQWRTRWRKSLLCRNCASISVVYHDTSNDDAAVMCGGCGMFLATRGQFRQLLERQAVRSRLVTTGC